MNLAAVLFDLDIEAAIPRWFELEQRHYPAWRAGEISFAEQRRRRTRDFFGALGITVRAEGLEGVFARYLAGYEAAWTAFDDAAPALHRVSASSRPRSSWSGTTTRSTSWGHAPRGCPPFTSTAQPDSADPAESASALSTTFSWDDRGKLLG